MSIWKYNGYTHFYARICNLRFWLFLHFWIWKPAPVLFSLYVKEATAREGASGARYEEFLFCCSPERISLLGVFHTSLRLKSFFIFDLLFVKCCPLDVNMPIGRWHSEGVCWDMAKSDMSSRSVLSWGRVRWYPGTRLALLRLLK